MLSHALIDDDRKGVILKDKETNLLHLVYKHRLLTTKQICMLVGATKGSSLYHSLTRRLRKFVKYNLLVRHEYDLGVKGVRFYYYRLGPKGYSVLVNIGLIPYSESGDLEILRKVSYIRNLDHYLGTQEVVINTLCSTDRTSIESYHPQEHLLLSDEFSETALVIPDWILKDENTFVYLELDTGTEGLPVIKDKVERYRDWANMNPLQQHFVVFVSLDDSFQSKKKYGDKVRRIGNMKRSSMNIFNEDPELENLEIFFLPLRTASTSINKMLSNTVPFNKEERVLEVEVGMRLFSELNSDFPYHLSEIPLDEVYFENTNERHKVEKVYQVQNESGTLIETIGMIHLHEGHLLSLERLDASYHLINEQKMKRRIDRLIAVYENQEELESDVLGEEYSNLLLGDNCSWEENLFTLPVFYKQVSPYRLEVTTFE
ncbi:replication-relaxation family protein [Rossellomorea sp. NPDC071047]|uniref:replication-relaxation family protein n=1 Tax=Rossellomorea sp. NPDC071047 TaxID=3390675 RepID=UPI003CFCDD65